MRSSRLRLVCCACAIPSALALSAATSASPQVPSAAEAAYFSEADTVLDCDQGAFTNDAFWAEVDDAIKGWRTAPELDRFRGFCDNLRNEPPGTDVFLENGEQCLAQYIYPGLSDEGVHRSAYPAAAYPELAALKERLEKEVAPAA